MVPQFPQKGRLPVKENRKGVHYFDHAADRSERWYRSHFPRQRVRSATGEAHTVTGEATPWYLFAPGAAERAAGVLPEAKLLAVLRNPVDRAHSHFLEQRRRGHEPLATFGDALEAEPQRCREGLVDAHGRRRSAAFAREHLTYTLQGEYDRGISTWLEHFDRDSLLVLRSEDVFANAPAELARVASFLGLADFVFRAERRNATSGADPDADSARRLARHYAPGVARLEAMLNQPMGWDLS